MIAPWVRTAIYVYILGVISCTALPCPCILSVAQRVTFRVQDFHTLFLPTGVLFCSLKIDPAVSELTCWGAVAGRVPIQRPTEVNGKALLGIWIKLPTKPIK